MLISFEARPETPPTPRSTPPLIPFRRDIDFVDDGKVDAIQQQFLARPSWYSRIALAGIGGVG